jgi:hypothetical protein
MYDAPARTLNIQRTGEIFNVAVEKLLYTRTYNRATVLRTRSLQHSRAAARNEPRSIGYARYSPVANQCD